MAEFTPTSGVGWTHNHDYTAGTFSFGMETTPTCQDPGQPYATAIHVENIPFSITSFEIKGGTLTMQGNRKGAVLMRIGIGGDPAGGDIGLGPGVGAIENMVENSAEEIPETVTIAGKKWDNIQNVISVPADGSPYKLVIFLQLAGNWSEPMDAEVELDGVWTA